MTNEFVDFNSFACLAFSGRGVDAAERPIWVTEELFVDSNVPLTIDEFWETELGGIATREVNEANTVLTAFSTGDNYETLKSYLHSFHYGLLLQGTGFNSGWEGAIFGGQIIDGKLHLSSMGEMLSFHEPSKVITPAITPNNLNLAVRLAAGIDSIYSHQHDDEQYLRLRKGFGAYVLGLRGDQLYIRLHQFVRAIEAVLKPRRNSLKTDFKERSKVFTGDNAQSEEILNDLYELRSAAEHLSPMRDKLERFGFQERVNIMVTRCYQAELLARFVYRTVLHDTALTQCFQSDATIENLWNGPIADRPPTFGAETLDLITAAVENYYPHLAPN